jgi:uroporphyrinogen III methyltransferase/synthase
VKSSGRDTKLPALPTQSFFNFLLLFLKRDTYFMPPPFSGPPGLLNNRTILVACSAKKLGELTDGLQALGGIVVPLPIIEAQAIEDTHLLDQSIGALKEYSWILFTSAYAVRFFMQRLSGRLNATHPTGMPNLCAIGPATAAELEEFGYEAALIPDRFQAEGVLDALGAYHDGIQNLDGMRILLPRAQEAREVLPQALAAAGARVDVVPCYKTVRAPIEGDILRRLRENSPDLIVFTSSSTIRHLFEIVGRQEADRLLSHAAVAVIGPVTGQTAESFGKRPEIVPRENTVKALIAAIRDYYSKERQ